MRSSRSSPNVRKSSKHQAPMLDQGMANPAFFQPMNEQPVLSKRLSQQKSRSPRQSQVKQPPSRPSFAGSHQNTGTRSPRQSLANQATSRPSYAAPHQESPRDLLPMQNTGGGPQWQGRAKRQMSPTPPTTRARKSVSPPPAVVTPPDASASDKKKHKHSQKLKSTDRPKTRKSHRTSASEQKRTSQQMEVKDADQKHMHPAVQEHILAELQLAQKAQRQQEIYNSSKPKKKAEKQGRQSRVDNSNGPQPEILHPYLQEHIMAERAIRESMQASGQQQQDPTFLTDGVDEKFASFAGNLLDAHQANSILGDRQELHQQLREERLRRHKEKKKNRKKGWFGRRSNHSRGSNDTSASSDGSGFEHASPTARRRSVTPPPPSRGQEAPKSPKSPKSIGRRIRRSLLPRRGKHKESNKAENPDAPTTITDPLLQQTIYESIRNMNVSDPSESRGTPARSLSGPQHRVSKREDAPRASRRRRQSHADIPDLGLTQDEQQAMLNSEITMVKRNNSMLDQGVPLHPARQQQAQPKQPATQERRKHRRSSSQPENVNTDKLRPATQQSAQPRGSSTELKEIAKIFASNEGESNGIDYQQLVKEQQAALEALQRKQGKREETKKATPAPAPAPSPQAPPARARARARAESPQGPPVYPKPLSEEYNIKPTPPLGLQQVRSEVSNRAPAVENVRAKRETGTPPAAAMPAQPGKEEVDFCGNSYDGSRSTYVPAEGEEDFFDWGSMDDPPPIKGDIITRDSFVSEITMPRGLLGGDGEYYSESEEEDFYAENYDSDDYVDDDEWERLEKAMQKGGPEAERQWAEFLKKQGQQEASGAPVNESSKAQAQSRPNAGGYAPSQMVDSDGEDPPPPQVAQLKSPPPPQVAQLKSPPPAHHSPHIPSPPPAHNAAHIPSPPYRQLSHIPSPPPPQVGDTPSSMVSARTTFVCECCAVRKSTRDHGHSCDNWDAPHMVCSVCIRNYLETSNAKFRMVEVANNQTMYQIKCFTALDGTHCNECNSKVTFHLKSIFALQDLESWLVRQRNRLHTMKSASRKHP